MRALLVTNSFATLTSRELVNRISTLLESKLDLTIKATSAREDGIEFGSQADNSNFDIVITLGGDGTANEVINGLLTLSPAKRPAFASLPGGNANVLSRNLGFSRKAEKATQELLTAISAENVIPIGLGKVNYRTANDIWHERYFAFNSGVGIDAEVLLAMQELRNRGKKVSDFAYARLAMRRIFIWMRRSTAQLEIESRKYFFAFVLNLSPWTYVSNRAINPAPTVNQLNALSIFAAREASARAFISVLRTLVLGKSFADLPSMVAFENRTELAMTTQLPMWLQVDGEPLDLMWEANFTHHLEALNMYAALGR